MPKEVIVMKFLRSKHKRDNFSNEKHFCGKQQYAVKRKQKRKQKSEVKLKVDWIWIQPCEASNDCNNIEKPRQRRAYYG